MTDEWGEWARPVPLLAAPMRVTWESCEIRPRTTRSPSGRWDGVAVRYRREPTSSSWETDARLAAWARPRGTTGPWGFVGLVYLSFCYTKHNRQGAHSGVPRWRWSWVVYSPELIEPAKPYVPSDYWAQGLSEAIAGLVAETGRPRPRIAAAGDPARDRWAG
jgi:hypothetical protein